MDPPSRSRRVPGAAAPRHASTLRDLERSECGAHGPLTVRTLDVTCSACRERIAARALTEVRELQLTLAEAVELLWSGAAASRR